MAVGAFFLTLALMIVFGLVPLMAGIWLIVKSRGKGLGYPGCGQCKYDLSGTLGTITRCPECGSDLKQVGVLPARITAKKGGMVVGILLLCVPLLCAGGGAFLASKSRASATRARQAVAPAPAAAAPQTSSASIVAPSPDPARVAEFRQQHANLSFDMAGYRLSEVGQQLGHAINDLDEEKVTALLAEQQALLELLNEFEKAPPPPPQP